MRRIPQLFDNFLDGIQSMILSLLVKLGPFAVALMPGLFSGYAIYFRFRVEAGLEMALLFAFTTAIALETVGIVSTYTAISLYNAKERGIIQPVKFKLMAWLVPVYVFGVSGVVYFSGEAFTPLVRSLGIASPWLTCIVYIAVALARDIKNVEDGQEKVESKQDEIDKDERDWEREKRLLEIEAEKTERQWQREKQQLEIELRHKEKLARIESKTVNQGVKQSVNLDVNQSSQVVKDNTRIDVFGTINMSKEERKKMLLDKMIDIYLDNPNVGVSTVANQLNVSRQTIYNYQDELKESGKIRRNGEGWTVRQRDEIG